MKVAKAFMLIICFAIVAALPLGCTKPQGTESGTQAVKASTGLILKCPSVTASPEVDGKPDDSVWRKASSIVIPLKKQEGVESGEIKLKAVHTSDMIYLLASYDDSTPLKVGEVWEFDGGEWHKGPYDDTLAFLWNIGDSIRDFNENGFAVMTKGLTSEDDIFDFRIDGEASETGLWPGYKQKGDFWGW